MNELREWFDYNTEDLKDTEKCKEVFKHMLERLENHGDCRRVFHILAFTLFSDSLGIEKIQEFTQEELKEN